MQNKTNKSIQQFRDRFSALIPAYNEEKNIYKVLKLTKQYVKTILVIDDGSVDKTVEKVRQFAKDYSDIVNLKLIQHKQNKGKGYALKEGLIYLATKTNVEYIVTLDADLQHDPADIQRFFLSFKTRYEDIVIGSRFAESSEHRMPFMRFLSNFCTSRFVKFFFGIPVLDIQCGYRAFRADAIKKIIPYLHKGKNFDLETEILIVAWSQRLKINQIPVKMIYGDYGRNSQISPFLDTLRWLYLMFRLLFDPYTYYLRRQSKFTRQKLSD